MATTHDRRDERAGVLRLLTFHALSWLVAANLVGLWLATLLLAPHLDLSLPTAGYGRWLPLHLDLHFYGWISLPLVGLLFSVYLPSRPGRMPRLAVGVWSGALAFSAVSWLAGRSSGKTFLEWTGAARWAWGAALAFVGVTVIRAYVQRRRELVERSAPRWQAIAKVATLVVLVPVPVALVWATSPGVYPPINPDSGGATATSTLGSVLGVVAILLAAPLLVGLRPTDGGRRGRRVFPLLALHFLVFAVLGHGDVSHHRPGQFLALASLIIWWPLGRWYLATFRWPEATRPWQRALGAWSALLLASGVLATTPGILERWKFTHVMVGHVHLALAGVCTCLCVLILQGLDHTHGLDPKHSPDHEPRISRALGAPRVAALWNAGLAVHVAALTWLGHLEGLDPQILWSGSTAVTTLFAVRWLAGATMTVASVVWCLRCLPAAAVDADWHRIRHDFPLRADEERHAPSSLASDLLPAGR